MSTQDKNNLIAEFMNNPLKPIYHECWNSLMQVAKKLKEITLYRSVIFNENHLSFDIEVLFENVSECVIWLFNNKEN